jgi:hypothetical protein
MGFIAEFQYRDCPWCGVRSVAMSPVIINQQTTTALGELRFWSPMWCPRCGGMLLVETTPPGATDRVLRVVPEGSDTGRNVNHVPDAVGRHYDAAVRVLDAGTPDLAAVALRRTLEAAAAQFGIGPSPLAKAVRAMIEKGLITADFARALGHVRKLGNLGAHATDEAMTAEEVHLALNFTTQVLRNLFEIPAELDLIENPEKPSTPSEDDGAPAT